MSASLVGSEMCIRDRPLLAAGGRRALPDSLRPQRLAASSGSATGTAAAVSYTHLTLPTICSV
eukprot:12758529-Alexandrium_andersonii.AAC.1